VAVGQNAGNTGQGANAIAIGYKAGQSNQPAGTIAFGEISAASTTPALLSFNAVTANTLGTSNHSARNEAPAGTPTLGGWIKVRLNDGTTTEDKYLYLYDNIV